MTKRIYTYDTETSKWGVGDFPRTSRSPSDHQSVSSLDGLTIYDVICPDVFTNMNYIALYKNDQIQHIKLSEITTLDVSENIIKINTADEVAFYMYCRNNNEANKIENRIFLILSGELDSGC